MKNGNAIEARRGNSLYEQIADTFNGRDNGTRRYPH